MQVLVRSKGSGTPASAGAPVVLVGPHRVRYASAVVHSVRTLGWRVLEMHHCAHLAMVCACYCGSRWLSQVPPRSVATDGLAWPLALSVSHGALGSVVDGRAGSRRGGFVRESPITQRPTQRRGVMRSPLTDVTRIPRLATASPRMWPLQTGDPRVRPCCGRSRLSCWDILRWGCSISSVRSVTVRMTLKWQPSTRSTTGSTGGASNSSRPEAARGAGSMKFRVQQLRLWCCAYRARMMPLCIAVPDAPCPLTRNTPLQHSRRTKR